MILAAGAVAAVVLMCSGSNDSPDEKPPAGSGASTSRTPGPSLSIPTELPSGLPTKLPTSLPSGFPTELPSGIPSEIETLFPDLQDQLP